MNEHTGNQEHQAGTTVPDFKKKIASTEITILCVAEAEKVIRAIGKDLIEELEPNARERPDEPPPRQARQSRRGRRRSKRPGGSAAGGNRKRRG